MNRGNRTMRLLAVGTVLAGLLTGCNITDQYQLDVDDVGKQIVADWKELPEVTAAAYEYRHGLDLGQIIYVAVYSSDNPPVDGRENLDKAIHSAHVETDPSDQAVAELEQKYGPRPARK